MEQKKNHLFSASGTWAACCPAVCLLLTLFVLTGCQDEMPMDSGEKSLSVAIPPGPLADDFETLAKQFSQDRGVSVQIVRRQANRIGRGDKTLPPCDLMAIHPRRFGEMVPAGRLTELTDWIPGNVDFKLMNPVAVRWYTQYPVGSKHVWAFPLEVDLLAFAYRKDLIGDPKEKDAYIDRTARDLSPPDTWKQLATQAEFFHRPKAGLYGCALLTSDRGDAVTIGFQQVLFCRDIGLGDPKTFRTDGILDGKAGIEALEMYARLARTGPPGADNFTPADTIRAFSEGKVAFAMGTLRDLGQLLEVEDLKDKVGFFVVPGRQLTDNFLKRGVSLAGTSLVINADVSPDQKALAKQLIRWFAEYDTQLKWARIGRHSIQSKILISNQFGPSASYRLIFQKSLPWLVDFWRTPETDKLLKITQKNWHNAISEKCSAAEAMKKTVDQQESVFGKAGLSNNNGSKDSN